MPKDVEECKVSVLEDNPDMDESQAYAICQAQQNKGNLSELSFEKDLAEDDPCWEGYVQVGMKTDENGNEVPNCVPEEDADLAQLAEGCPEGHVKINGECTPIEEVEDVPPSALDLSTPRIMQGATRLDLQPIEREELPNGEVAYRNMSLIDAGVWTDAGSGEATEYDPAELEVVEDNVVNIMHDADNEVSEVGYIDASSYRVDDGTGFADIVLDMDSAASEYADENLQETLESGGEVGFGGPSIEIPAGAYDLEDTPNGHPKLVNGEIHGLAFVADPASKKTSFARQVAERGVAMSSGGQNPMVYTLQDDAMSDKTLQEIGEEELSGIIGGAHQDAFDSITDLYEAADDAEAFGGGLSDILDNAQETILENAFGEGEEEGDEDVENAEGDYEDKDKSEHEEEEEEDAEMAENMDMEEVVSMVQAVRERVDELEEEHDALMQASDMEAELSEATEELRQDLAAADTVKELKDAKEDLDKRLSKLEDEPKPTKSLSDNGDNSDEWKEWASASGTPETTPNSMR